jgi:hypothetical protein
MRREAVLDSGGGLVVRFLDVAPGDVQTVLDAFQRLQVAGKGIARTLADELTLGWNQRTLEPGTIERLSKWCSTRGRHAAATPVAMGVARLLLGTSLPRLVNKENDRTGDYRELVLPLVDEINLAEGICDVDWDNSLANGNYRAQVLERLWRYSDQYLVPASDHLELVRDENPNRPPVLLPNRADQNVLRGPQVGFHRQLLDLVPRSKRHRWFRSMTSSQALTQSVFGNLIVSGNLSILGEITCDDGEPFIESQHLVGSAASLEFAVGYLGEQRSSSVDVRIQGDYGLSIECKFMEADVGTCSRPRLTERDANFEEDHCDGSYTVQRRRQGRCSLTSGGAKYWQFLPQLFDWPADEDRTPCPFSGVYQLARNVMASTVRDDGVLVPDQGHAVLVYDSRNPSCIAQGRIAQAYSRMRQELRRAAHIRKCSWQTLLACIKRTRGLEWLAAAVAEKYGL